MRYALSDKIQVTFSTKGKQILKMKNILVSNTIDNKNWFQIWELIMYFGKNTISLHNSNPIIRNKFFK